MPFGQDQMREKAVQITSTKFVDVHEWKSMAVWMILTLSWREQIPATGAYLA